MKNPLLFVLFMSFSCLLSAQTKPDKEKEKVKQLIKDAFEEVWSDLDTESLKKYHTDDFLLLENGVVWNNDSIRNYQIKELKEIGDTKRNNKFNFIKTEKTGNTIWVAYHNYATWTTGDKVTGNAHWLESAVAIKTAEGWKLQMLHSTRVRNE